jgi:hypothetical protein
MQKQLLNFLAYVAIYYLAFWAYEASAQYSIIASSTNICVGTDVTLTASGLPPNARIFWNTGDTATRTIVRTPLTSTTYSFNVLVGTVSMGSATVSINVVPNTITLTTDKTSLCVAGDSARLTTSIGTPCAVCVVRYYNSAGVQLAMRTGLPDAVGVRVPAGGGYYARLDDCNSVSNTVSVAASPINASVFYSPDTVLCGTGDSSVLFATGFCSSCAFSWRRNGVVITGATGNLLQASVSGLYQVSVSDLSTGCSGTASRNMLSAAGILDTVTFFAISTSETETALDSMLNYVLPAASASFARAYSSPHISQVAGVYVFDARAAGVGTHAITVSIASAGCTTFRTAYVQVVAAPLSIGLQSQYCSNSGLDTILRAPAFAYGELNGGTQIVYSNVMSVSATNYSGTFSPQCGLAPAGQCFVFDLSQTTGLSTVVTTTYRHRIEFYSGGVLTASRMYIVGRTVDTISTSSNAVVDILTPDTLFCAGQTFRPIQVTPSIGRFEVKQLDGSAPDSMRATINVNNGVAVVSIANLYAGETTNVSYRMYYTVGAVGCSTTDSVNILIPQPADAGFTTAYNSTKRYCQSDLPDTLSPLILPQNRTNTSFFTINNVLAIDRIFDPMDNNKVLVGNNIINHTIANAYGCVSTFVDTFVMSSLPLVSFSALNNRYCVYANAAVLSATASPTSGSGILYMESAARARTIIANPYTLNPSMLGSSSQPEQLIFTYVHTNASGCVDSAVATTTLNPRPEVSLAPLEPTYCRDNNMYINLSPFPTGGTISSRRLSGGGGNNVNTNAATYRLDNRNRDEISYTYTSPSTGCINTYRDTVEVVNSSFWSWEDIDILAPVTSFCFVDDTIQFIGSRSGGASGTPRFYTNATTMNGGIIYQNQDTARFVPNQASMGQLVLTYSLTRGGCALVTQQTIRVNPLPNLRIDYGAAAATYPAYQRQMFGDTALCEYSRSFVSIFNLNQSVSTPLLPTQFTYTGIGYSTNAAANTVEFNSEAVPIATRIGMHPISVNYTDANGCRASASSSIEVLPNNAPNIVGVSPVYCVGSPSDTIFGLPANGTWSFNFSPTAPNPNPTFGLAIPNPNGVSPYAVIQPRATGTVELFYTINNPNGCFNVQTNTFSIQPSLRISINSPATVCANNGAVRLSATNTVNSQDITRAINFSYFRNGQPFVAAIFNDSMLNPNIIGYDANSNDTIVATYADAQSGCVDTARIAISILPAPTPVITFPNAAGPNNNIYCVDTTIGTTTTILGGNNVGGTALGIFSSRRNRISASSNTTADFRTDSILIDTISYVVTNNSGCRDSISRTIEIRGLPIGLVLAGVQPRYCQGTDPLNISGFPTPSPSDGIVGEVLISNLSNNQVTNYGTNIVNLPSITSLNVGRYRVSYNYSNEFGCASSISANFDIHPSPIADFQQIGFCAGDTLQFNDISTFSSIYNNLDSITNWRWLFNNQTAPDSSTVFFSPQIPNSYLAQLTVVSAAGCAAQRLNIISIYKYPNVAFAIDGGCQNSPISFSLDSTGLNPGTDSLTTALWNFGNGNTDSQNTIINNFCQVRNSSHQYTGQGVFYPSLTLSNRGLCTSVDSLRLVISPVVTLQSVTPNPPQPNIITNTPYSANFEQTTNGWYSAQDDGQSDWHWGFAGTNGGSERINTLPTTNPYRKVWTTSVGISGQDSVSQFNNFVGESPSWIYSPCFDFTYSERPMIKFDYITDMRTIVDGATMEYYDTRPNPNNNNREYGWRRLGEVGRGINWYNSTNLVSLFNLPNVREVNLLHGWSDTSDTWQTARYRLEQFRGKRNIRFRMAFAAAITNNTGGATGTPYNGIAIDNMWIGERGRGALIEHFTNDNLFQMQATNQHIYNIAFSDNNYQDIALIQYHSNANGTDPYHTFSADNGGSARILKYGIGNSGDGRVVIDGNYWLGASDSLREQIIEHQILQDPYFNIEGITEPVIKLDVSQQTAELSAQITALQNLPLSEYFVYPTIVEDSIISTNTGMLRSVFRTFLPSATGLRQVRSWQVGDQASINQTWNYDNSLVNGSLLKAVVFIQDSTGKVYHAVTTLNFDVRIVGVEQQANYNAAANAFSLQLFPNPATDQATLAFDSPLQTDFDWQLFDMRGVSLQKGLAPSGVSQVQLNLYDLPAGVYVLHVQDKNGAVRVQRRLVVHKP